MVPRGVFRFFATPGKKIVHCKKPSKNIGLLCLRTQFYSDGDALIVVVKTASELVQSLSYSRLGQTELKSCPLCATRLKSTPIGGKIRQACPACEFVHWDNPKPVTATLVPMEGGLVLVKRKFEPFVGHWCLPGGFMEATEHPEQSAAREVLEETGLEIEISRLLGAETPGRGINVLILFYLARQARGTMKAGDDASDVGAFTKNELPENIAFELHRKMIRDFFELSKKLR